MTIEQTTEYCRYCGSTQTVKNESGYCEPCLNLNISDLCRHILTILTNLEHLLDVSKDEFLSDKLLQQAVGFQLMKWARWCVSAPNRFRTRFPEIDMRSSWLMVDYPDWKGIYGIRDQIAKMKQVAQSAIL